jgi:diadenosine tetraphosphatase ApaH/serine/threonine PP2A family protein phosphatase
MAAQLALEIELLASVLFCHATPRNDTEIFTRNTDESRLIPIFANVAANITVCGHTHMQFDRLIGRKRVVNAGSVGMPFGDPGAHLLELGCGIRLRRTEYDLDVAAERIRRTEYPRALDVATGNVLRPPSEQQILDAYANAELR